MWVTGHIGGYATEFCIMSDNQLVFSKFTMYLSKPKKIIQIEKKFNCVF